MARPAPSPLYTLRGAGSPLNTLHFGCCEGDPPLLFSGSGQGSVHVWNLTTRRAERVLEGHSGASVTWLNTLHSRDTLISQGRDMRVCLWDLAEGRGDVTDALWTGSVGFCRCSLLETGPGRWLLAHAGEAMEEPDSSPGPLLLAGYEDGSLALWDVSQRSVLSRAAAHPEPVMCLDFDPAGQRGVSGSSEKSLASWMLDGQHRLQLQEPVALVNPGISQLCIRGDRKIVASAGWDHRVRVFGWKKLRPLAVLQHHTDMVLSLAFSDHQDPRNRMLAAGSKDQRISLWSIYNQGSSDTG
ncbi:guanine nucleotide-binding protein subunit beta-like protein 1 isoform X2 [Salmo salar]|uniref:Guanine nucleotide-binding protein subunit beta-like protein 1 isoform X2 n=1 Tax=Salmo salar TaxID=8030 RepID=A0A1S3PFC1_SALSA|nr:guanine nucleotide-binding protein subunit beta-like protein 1 isoform X2 [Salmo salar]|eukprot:XP_014026398.1 PREDICTED: guanine nucleotide-binding protein subunit beta-like protein 1 isoform X2 [Salmo salar]